MRRLLSALFLLSLTEVSAAVMPVIDIESIIQLTSQLKQLQEQYKLLENAYNTAKAQLENSKAQLDGIKHLQEYNSGSYGYGSLQNAASNLQGWQSSASTWDDALKNVAGGNPARYAELVKAYESAHPMVSESVFKKGASQTRLHQYSQNKALNKAVSVQTTYAYNDINDHLKRIHELSSNIDKAPNTKAAMDLNSRLVAELAYVSVTNLKLQTLISQQLAQSGANELVDDGEAARFFTLPDR